SLVQGSFGWSQRFIPTLMACGLHSSQVQRSVMAIWSRPLLRPAFLPPLLYCLAMRCFLWSLQALPHFLSAKMKSASCGDCTRICACCVKKLPHCAEDYAIRLMLRMGLMVKARVRIDWIMKSTQKGNTHAN